MSHPWNELDDKAVTISRALAMDAVQKVGNGHPGTAMALAPVAYTLFQRIMKHDPTDPNWLGRDRFVLSAGHSSLTLYVQLFLSGYGLELSDLQSFRTAGSKTPGHPEFGHTAGVEITTGPLGSGIASAIGMAMAARYEKGLFDPDGATKLFDHDIWVIASDGDLQEGLSAEASSLAGTQELGNLKVIYDDNRISIEGDTHFAFTEDVSARYKAYGWNVIEVAARAVGDVDQIALESAMLAAQVETSKPTLIRLKTVIAWPAPKAQGTHESHGSALGSDEVAATKIALGLNPEESFIVPAEVLAHAREVVTRGAAAHAKWQTEFNVWKKKNPEQSDLLQRLDAKELPTGWEKVIPVFESGKDIATRAASGKIISALAGVLPEFWGGSSDLAGSNNTSISGAKSFLPKSSKMANSDPFGRIIHFGIREHAMGAILNGIALHGLTRCFGGTFLVFSDYMRGAVRLAALMNIPSIFVWTHDSIGLGEDGPTHQPVEHLASLRLIPNLAIVRPADANETAIAWREAISRRKPVGFALSRQNLPVLDRQKFASAEGVAKGAYIVSDSPEKPDVIIIATGSEVAIAIAASELLQLKSVTARVVSAPCLEWFEEQSDSYKESVLPKEITARVSVEAGVGAGWHKYVGDKGEIVSLEHFGASASASELFKEYGFTPENIADAAMRTIARN
ncbi:MAG: transketolase [Actinobacteria bacterium]|uniref:transketolase n=1 Tax=freshwater metagenome TaxID=449393 RepID=A0A6J7FNY8_9ZZZZ|nr:transketolase [Actinomycetota bacterium]MSW22290.1 transketolase [Actinomycetota bacterium]MSX04091.1 transketolase [Actinomycetota bacterium]MSX61158.1 transketolase [Actinomycetota bacterium]MSX84260.1 transketolase [Actinomycetota bacterium]